MSPTILWSSFLDPKWNLMWLWASACGLDPFASFSDFRGSTSAGLHGLLIRREGDFSDGAKRTKVEDLDGVRVVSHLQQAVDFVREWNDACSDRVV